MGNESCTQGARRGELGVRRFAAVLFIFCASIGIASSPIAAASTGDDPVTGASPLDPVHLKGPAPPPLTVEQLAQLAEDRAEGQEGDGQNEEFPNLSPSQAAQLLNQVFGDQIASLIFTPADALEQSDGVEEIVGESSALVDPAGPSTHALIDSTVPLVTEDGQPVDLALETTAEGLETANGLAPIVLPGTLNEPAQISDIGLELEFPGSNELSSVRTIDVDADQDREVAVYPEAFTDADIALAPSTSGLEYMAQIRSADAPENLPLELGGGDFTLEPTEDGGVAIIEADQQVGAVSPPISLDANGKAVPTALEIDGNMITVRVDHRDGDYSYPILMDPVIESWDWWTAGQSSYDFSAWTSGQSGSTNYQLTTTCTSGVTDSCTGSGRGIYVNARPNYNFAASSYGQWVYNVPWSQYGASNDTYIHEAESNSWRYMKGTATNTNPYGYLGLNGTDGWDVYKQYVTVGDGGSGNKFIGNPTAKQFIAGLGSAVNVTLPAGGHRFLRVAAISIELRDGNGSPTSGYPVQSSFNVSTQVPTRWLGATDNFNISPTFQDTGVGIKFMGALSVAKAGGWWGVALNGESSTGVACTGLIASKCPRSLTGNLLIKPGEMANGLTNVQPYAQDALAKPVNGTNFQIKVDNVRPTVSLSGSATSTTNPGPILTVDANDTNGALPVSGIERIEVFVDEESVYSEELTCDGANQSCASTETRQVQIPLEKLMGTGHEIRVEVEDQAGNIGQDPAHQAPEVPYNPTNKPFTTPTSGATASAGCGNVKWYHVNNNGIVQGTRCDDLITPNKIKPQNPNQKNKEVTAIYAGEGNDTISGGFGGQDIYGGAGNDVLLGGLNNDDLFGGAGADKLYGGIGDDVLKGQTGNDILVGGGGTDEMDGGVGADYLQSGQGSDQVSGGPENDRYKDESDHSVDYVDTVSFEDGVSPGFSYSASGPNDQNIDEPTGFPLVTSESRGVRVDLDAKRRKKKGDDTSALVPAPSADNGAARLGGAGDSLCLRNEHWGTRYENGTMRSVSFCRQGGNFENIVGSAFSDIIDVGSKTGSIALYGGAGDDLLRAGTTTGPLYGGPGNDLLDGGTGASVNGWGQEGNDNCLNVANSGCGEGSASEVNATARSNKLIDVGASNPEAVRGPNQGSANFYMDGSSGADNVLAEVKNGSVVFTIRGEQAAQAANGTVPARPEYESEGRFRVGSGNGCTVPATDPGDHSKGGKTATCPLSGRGLGAIVMAGGPGDDHLNVGDTGQQTLTYLLGGTGRDGLGGAKGDEIIVDGDNQGGGSYPEWLQGGVGEDIIIQNRGFDYVTGGTGADLLLNTSLCEGDKVYGGDQRDNLQFAQLPAPAASDIFGAKHSEQSNRGAFVDLQNNEVGIYDRENNTNAANCAGGSLMKIGGIEVVEASSNSDKIVGNGQDNFILARGGRDRLIGNNGSDRLFAHDGNEGRHFDEQIDCGGNAGDYALIAKGNDPNPTGCGSNPGATKKYRYGGPAFAPYTETLQVLKSNDETWLLGVVEETDELDDTDDPIDFGYDWQETTPPPSAEFSLDEQSGSTASNSASRSEVGIYKSSTTAVTGGIGPEVGLDGVEEGTMEDETGAKLDGLDDFVQLGDSVPADSSEGFTVSVSFKPDAASTTEQQLYTRPMEDGDYALVLNSENRVALRVAGEESEVQVESGETITPGEWHQAVGVIKGGHLELYVDGYESSVDGAPSLMSPNDAQPASAGADLNSVDLPVHAFDGVIDDIEIFDEALAADEVVGDLGLTEVPVPEEMVTPTMNLTDTDSDGYPDLQDTCPSVSDPTQADGDLNGIGDACDAPLDSDGDGVADSTDNCPDVANESQDDSDSNGVGDECTLLSGE